MEELNIQSTSCSTNCSIFSPSILQVDVIRLNLRQKGVYGVSVQNLANIQGTVGLRTSLSTGAQGTCLIYKKRGKKIELHFYFSHNVNMHIHFKIIFNLQLPHSNSVSLGRQFRVIIITTVQTRDRLLQSDSS